MSLNIDDDGNKKSGLRIPMRGYEKDENGEINIKLESYESP